MAGSQTLLLTADNSSVTPPGFFKTSPHHLFQLVYGGSNLKGCFNFMHPGNTPCIISSPHHWKEIICSPKLLGILYHLPRETYVAFDVSWLNKRQVALFCHYFWSLACILLLFVLVCLLLYKRNHPHSVNFLCHTKDTLIEQKCLLTKANTVHVPQQSQHFPLRQITFIPYATFHLQLEAPTGHCSFPLDNLKT